MRGLSFARISNSLTSEPLFSRWNVTAPAVVVAVLTAHPVSVMVTGIALARSALATQPDRITARATVATGAAAKGARRIMDTPGLWWSRAWVMRETCV